MISLPPWTRPPMRSLKRRDLKPPKPRSIAADDRTLAESCGKDTLSMLMSTAGRNLTQPVAIASTGR